MSTPSKDTIAAVATPPGRGGVGMLRLSGPQALEIAQQLSGAELPSPRTAALRTFNDHSGAAIDQGLLLTFTAPNSFTGEDVAELQTHGSPVVLDLLLRAACAAGARVARPGEFSERAFLNDRIDLAQAEAIADLIDAGTEQAARAAQRSLDGELSRRVQALVEELTQLRTFVEGALDFSDEDIDWLSDDRLRSRLAELRTNLDALRAATSQGRRLREGMTVALVGQPNVGKSTLLNALAGAEAAIVTDVPGTTRDLLRENIQIDGMPLTLIDTAGLRVSSDPVERIGIERAWQALAQAEAALFLVDDRKGITEEDRRLLAQVPHDATVLVLRNKCDLSAAEPEVLEVNARKHIRLSAKQGAGLDLLRSELSLIAGLGDGSEGLFSARTRHVDAIRRAQAGVQDAERRLQEGSTAELAAEELRLAQQALSEITGAFTADDLLGRIFSEFCIGK